MIIEEVTVTAFQQHTRIVGCEETRRAICIDPGDDSATIAAAIDRHGFELQAIACTHAHLDHIASIPIFIDEEFRRLTSPLIVYALPEVILSLRQFVFNDQIWPNFEKITVNP